VDRSETLLRAGRARLDAAVVADAAALPFRDGVADAVLCSQLLHHFEESDARRVLAELHRVTRRAAIVADLRRSRLAALGFSIASFALRWHPITRHDGVASVRRGFTPGELGALVRDATGVTPRVRRGLFWRLTAAWSR
jgi:SAM-dependent methyltransferase